MKSRRRISRKFIFGAGIATALFTLYLHFGLLPGDSKDYAVREIEKFTNKKISFSKILYLPVEGLSLHNVKFMEKNGTPIFSAKKLAVQVRFLPFFNEKKVVVSNLYLDTPVYDLKMQPQTAATPKPPVKTQISGQINVPVVPDQKKIDLNTLREEGADAFLPENVYLQQVEIANGTVTLRKNAASPVIEEINAINVRMGFRKPPELSFDGSVRLGHSPYASISLKGRWDLEKAAYEFHLDAKSDGLPPWLLNYQKNNFLVLTKSRLKVSAHLKSLGETLALFHTKVQLKDAEIKAGSASYRGQMGLDVEGLFNFNTKRFDRYRGTLELKDVEVLNLTKTIDELSGVNGRVNFRPDLLEFVDIRGGYKDIVFQSAGALKNFKERNLEQKILVDSDIHKVLALVPDDKKKWIKDFTLSGRCQAVTNVKGSLKAPGGLDIEYKLRIDDGSIHNTAKKISMTGVSADLYVNDAGFKIKNSRLRYGGKDYAFDAFVPKKPETPGSLRLQSDELLVNADYLLNGGTLTVKNAHVQAKGVAADVSGKIYDLENPYCELGGRFDAHLERAAEGFKKEAPALKAMGLGGNLKGVFSMKGLWNHPMDWDLKAEGQSPFILVGKKIRLMDFQMQARMQDRMLRVPFLRAQGYGGTLSGDMAFNFKGASSFQGKIIASNVDLRPLAQDLDEKQKEVSGTMTISTTLSGLMGAQESYRGSGRVDIRDGKLFKTDLFKQMGNLPFVKVEGLDMVEFTTMNASFEIRDKRAWTEDMLLLSETVNLSLRGSAGFDQSLDMLMDIRYSEGVIDGAYDTGGFVPFVVQQAENSISQYKVSGTIQKPQYDKISSPVGVVSRTVGRTVTGIVKTVVQ